MLFSSWHVGGTLEANFDHIFNGRFKTVAWEKEVKTTLRRRFRDIDAAMPLILASKNGLALKNDVIHFWTFNAAQKVAAYQHYNDTAAELAAWRN